jgi:Asp-tRNA(Asn)/Glu-tRNA(Gln) amidotransferase A subunit family amidase
MSTDLSALPVHALSAGLTAGQFSSVDLVDACLARIAALEPKLQAFVHVHEARRGRRLKPPTKRSAPGRPSVRCMAFPSRSRTWWK